MAGCGTCHKNHPTDKHDVVQAAVEAQEAALARSRKVRENGGPCEVCSQNHPTYECCDACNYDIHTCHFCGDTLGHAGVSACYILLKDEERDPDGWADRGVTGDEGKPA